MSTFEELGLDPSVLCALKKMKFLIPTDIQAAAIPFSLKGRDLLASARTGTGKTGAFSIPLVHALIKNNNSQALVLTPTRELAQQVLNVIRDIVIGCEIGNNDKSLKTAFLIGGAPMKLQMRQLSANPRIIVGTPGRINDHLKRKSLNISKTNFLVIDETDRMLDMGFCVQIDEIIKYMPRTYQTLMFAATMGVDVERLARKYLREPEKISLICDKSTKPDIDQQIIRIQHHEKYDELKKQLTMRKGAIIVFVNTKLAADEIVQMLKNDNINAKAIHGNLRQKSRDVVIKNFRRQKYRILIATDVASRGIDIPHIEHVINYDLPMCSEDYIHRIGRTGRAGAKGESICFVTQKEERKSFAIRKIIDPSLKNFSPKISNESPRRGKKDNSNEVSKKGAKRLFDDKKKSGNFVKRNVLWEKNPKFADKKRSLSFDSRGACESSVKKRFVSNVKIKEDMPKKNFSFYNKQFDSKTMQNSKFFANKKKPDIMQQSGNERYKLNTEKLSKNSQKKKYISADKGGNFFKYKKDRK